MINSFLWHSRNQKKWKIPFIRSSDSAGQLIYLISTCYIAIQHMFLEDFFFFWYLVQLYEFGLSHTQSFFTIIQAYCFSNLFEHLFKNHFIFRFLLGCLNFCFSLSPCNFYAFINNLISLAELIKWKIFLKKKYDICVIF